MVNIRVYLDNCVYNRPFDDQTQIKIALETEKGINVLLEQLGVLDTEQFISTLLKEPFDYTEWSRQYFADYNPEQFLKDAVAYDTQYPVA
jgi:ligand-binding SRPBCC domain-containing protein